MRVHVRGEGEREREGWREGGRRRKKKKKQKQKKNEKTWTWDGDRWIGEEICGYYMVVVSFFIQKFIQLVGKIGVPRVIRSFQEEFHSWTTWSGP